MFKIAIAATMIAATRADGFDDILGGDTDVHDHMPQNTTKPIVDPIDIPQVDGN